MTEKASDANEILCDNNTLKSYHVNRSDFLKETWLSGQNLQYKKILSTKPSFFFSNLTNWLDESLQCCCCTITCSRLKLFWSLVMFILLYSPWDPYKLVGNKKNFFFLLKISSRKPSFLKKSDQLTWWVFTIRCRTTTCSRLKLFW